ncbi:hypothetical protein LJC37_05385, partial [Bacteroidales bacterium OttesenSCG-928-E04]|nr:hypothetical protein [Bacteroidales bacterium OttesenSCG-928-E04]
ANSNIPVKNFRFYFLKSLPDSNKMQPFVQPGRQATKTLKWKIVWSFSCDLARKITINRYYSFSKIFIINLIFVG